MNIDDATAREWMDLDLDGELGPAEKAQLEKRLETDAGLRAERRVLSSIFALLAGGRIAVREKFAARVTSSLPEAAWERRLSRKGLPAWSLPVALVVIFGIGAAGMLAGSPAPDSQVFGLLGALADFFGTTLLAGAGLLFATWRGAGLGLEALIAESGMSLLALALAAVFLDLLFVSLLRRRTAAPAVRKRR